LDGGVHDFETLVEFLAQVMQEFVARRRFRHERCEMSP
jgi:hypothetical protein